MATMLKDELTEKFGKPGLFTIEENEHGLLRGIITLPSCTAEVYLQGAHLTQWQPTGHEAVLFLSERSAFVPGKAIRGGVPIIFPWFGPRTATPSSSRTDGPSHGFVRTAIWQLHSATIDGDKIDLELTLAPDDISRTLGYDNFLLTYKLTLGAKLSMMLTVANHSDNPLHFEEALHTYFMVDDTKQISIAGLADTEYLDKTDGFKRKRQNEPVLHLTGETDRPYLNTDSAVSIEDPLVKRTIVVSKENSLTTVVWNPWSELTAKLSDMNPDGWMHMVCVESANAGENAITLGPGAEHTLVTRIGVEQYHAQK
jgi:glucose-6-phosphate 1-epimerase